MSKLFLALDASGAMRFIGEVERGAECACHCPECGSALVARQGMANDWHFAHDTAQERPECDAAALRLLRQFVIDHLRSRTAAPDFALPVYRQDVVLTRSLVHLREEVQWEARLVGELRWTADQADVSGENQGGEVREAGERRPVARGQLDTNEDLQVFVEVGDATPAPWPVDDGVARLVFRLRQPGASFFRDRTAAERQLRAAGELVWEHHPDSHGLVHAAQERLEVRGRRIYRNWLSMADAARQGSADSAAPASPLFYGPVAPGIVDAARRHACAPQHAPNVQFTFYRLSPQEAWLLYLLERVGPSDWRTAQQKFYALAPYPGPFDGWTQAIPRAVGVADESLGIVRLVGFLDAVTYLSRRARLTRSDRDPTAFTEL